MEPGLVHCNKTSIWAYLISPVTLETPQGQHISYTTLYWMMPSTGLGTVGMQ